MNKRFARWLMAVTTGFAMLMFSPLATAGKPETATVDFEKYLAAWSNDIEKLMPYFTEDVVYEDVTLGVVNHGKDETRAFALNFFKTFPDTRFTLTSAVVSGNHAAIEWTLTGTQTGDMPGMPAAGKKISIRGVSTMELRHGKISRDADYWDMATMRRQLGFNP